MIEKFQSVLVLAPHTDDGELGCGGTIVRLIEKKADVTYVAFSTADHSLPKGFPKGILKAEVKCATATLGIDPKNLIIYDYEVRKLNYVRQEILEKLIELRGQKNFDLILMPSLHDIHQDHVTVATEGLRAFKGHTILGYELIWNNVSFNTQSFVKLAKRHIQKKALSLLEYKSQFGRDYMKNDFILSLAKTRGVQIGAKFAEAFEVVRLIL